MSFKLKKDFLKQYKSKRPDFGFNGLGEIVYLRTYSRLKDDGSKEKWWETVQRVVEWVFDTQKNHIQSNTLGWDDDKANSMAEDMFDRMFSMKFLPPGRGLWIAGTEGLRDKPIAAALNNCAYVSTENINTDISKPFCFLVDMSMLGVGVGFDTKGAGKIQIKEPKSKSGVYVIPDSREGWVEAFKITLEAFFVGSNLPEFDYSKIRKYGEPIKGFGGTASGHKPLEKLIEDIKEMFDGRAGEKITETDIVDIMNKAGVMVVAGNVRRTAEIAIGSHKSIEFMNLKSYKYDASTGSYVGDMAHRAEYGWTSNNSVFADIGMDYSNISDKICGNGEPGIIWLDNIQKYSRMCDKADNKDIKAVGVNPCCEQSLESYELCCLVETFPHRCGDINDYLATLKCAYMYAKTVTLCNTHFPETNRVMLRNRRIGTSMSGIAQIYETKGLDYLKGLCESGYKEIQRLDETYSNWLCVPKSIKMTSIKPSGTVSLLAGATPGVHFPIDNCYIRRVRIASSSDMISPLVEAGYKVEPDLGDVTGKTMVVEVPVIIEGIRSLDDVSMWEQLSLAAFMQKYWADNQVSVTVSFDRDTEGDQIKNALNFFQYQLKGVSFLPKEKNTFHQMPYESISTKTYGELIGNIRPINWGDNGDSAIGEKFCSNDTCSL